MIFLKKNAILYQYLFGNLFPKCFCRINDYGINAKTLFNTYYHNFNLQKNIINWQPKQENDSPINMTTLNDDDDDVVGNDNDNDCSKNVNEEKKEKKEKNVKRKIKNEEAKKQKREAKKQRLLEQLNENTEKIKKTKKK